MEDIVKEKSVWAFGGFAHFFIYSSTIIVSIRSMTRENNIGDVFQLTFGAWGIAYVIALICKAFDVAAKEEIKNNLLLAEKEDNFRELQEVALKKYLESMGVKS
jgi:hypothetical protein